jgi:hypothetical protein
MGRSFVLAGVLVIGLPLVGHAQTGPQTESIGSPADTAVVELVLRREVFAYPAFERRDPFMPLLSLDSGPRFDQMRLTGILFDSADPGSSIAVIAAELGGANAAPQLAAGQAAPTGQVRRLRAGERWGNVRIVRVEENRVVVDVNNFGVVESRVMLLNTRGQGGS